MIITKAELITVALPLKKSFTVSFGTFKERVSLLVKLYTKEGLTGFGECAAFQFPTYIPCFTDEEQLVMKNFLLPAVLGKNVGNCSELKAHLAFVKGHGMAKAALEFALWHIIAVQQKKSLKALFGGTQTTIVVGTSIGIQNSIEATLDEVEKALQAGYKRIKIKIKRGWDGHVARAIRQKYPDIPLMLDGNADYAPEDFEDLLTLDEFNLLMLEQPLAYNDLVYHAELQKQMKTPICLDESILDSEDAKRALLIGSCRVINIKPGRVGGALEFIAIHDLCTLHRIPVWCGGLLETGIGRAFNLALASLPNFSLPADMSSPLEFFEEDMVDDSYTIVNGEIKVPTKPGLGFTINEKVIAKYTVGREVVSA